ncbi:MAG: hypothetical protein HY294_06765 [Candidatus Rokubacteria bacterium]|nr:hypothetical protein [Candidatus Rokubacteria bacterium]
MGREGFWQVVQRAQTDPTFARRLRSDPDGTLAHGDVRLEPDDVAEVKRFLVTVPDPPAPLPFMPGGPAMHPEDVEFQRKMWKHRFEVQMKRMDDLSGYSLALVKGTFDSAKSTYKTITWMNRVMFAVGIGLFLFAALYAVYSEQKIYSLVFGGLGVASFVTLFMLGPIDKTQRALSNLVQAEIAFMNYFDQISFWENYAQAPQVIPPGAPDPANIARASVGLQERSRETIELLQRFVEDGPREGERRGSRLRRPTSPAPPATPTAPDAGRGPLPPAPPLPDAGPLGRPAPS